MLGVVIIPFVLDVRLVDAPTGVTQEEGRTEFIHLASVVLAFIFVARMIQPSLSLVDREVNFVYPRINRSPLVGHFFFRGRKNPSSCVLPVFQNLNYKLYRRLSDVLPNQQSRQKGYKKI